MRQTVMIPTPTPPTPPPTPQGGLAEGLKQTVQEAVAGALQGTRAELQRDVIRLEARRNGLQAALDAAPNGPARSAIQRQLSNTEEELAKTQNALEKIERQLTTRDGPRETFSGTIPAPRFPSAPVQRFDPTPLVFGVLGILFVAFPLTLAMVRFLWKRASNAPPPAITAEQTRRFDRIEQSVDAIAIEVERISENQRYLTKLLGESRTSAKIGS
jgi:hypothetical protein